MTRPYPVQNDLRTCHVSRGRFPTMRNGLHFVPLRAQFDARLWWKTGACVHSEVVFRTESSVVSHKRSRRPARSWRAGGRPGRGGRRRESRRRNCHSRTQPQPPGSSKEQQSSHACRDHTFPQAVPLSVACPPPHPRSPRRPPRHVRRENHRRRSGGRHGWP